MTEQVRRKRLVSFKFLIVVILLGALMPLVIAGWADLWTSFLERTPPDLELVDVPRGIGVVPASITIQVSDSGAGLDGVVVRAFQRGRSIDLFSESYKRDESAEFTVSLSGREHGFSEGTVELEIRAFDKSFWSNTSTERVRLKIDYRKPVLKVLTTQHNIQKGGSQLIMYEAHDDNLVFHGVKVGSNTYLGFPARGLDPAFENTATYAAFFSVQLTDDDTPDIRLFAEDQVGNGSSQRFYHKVAATPVRPERIRLTTSFLQGEVLQLYRQNLETLQEWAREIGQPEPKPINEVTIEIALKVFTFLNRVLRSWSDLELERLLHEQRLDRLWDGPFLSATGTVRSAFGRKLFYVYNEQEVDTALQTGYELSGGGGVRASNRGIVAFVQNVGLYGKTLAIDHGLGVYSLYSWLSDVDVAVGEEVLAGQVVGSAGGLGFSVADAYLFQMRIGGRAVSPREWWDRRWYYGHVIEKINRVKRELGLGNVRNSL